MRRYIRVWRRAGWSAVILSAMGVPGGQALATPVAVSILEAEQLPTMAPVLAFKGVTVIDVMNGERRLDQTVVIAGSRIQSITPAADAQVPTGALLIDARGKYLIPGLWDMHVHGMEGAHPDAWERAITSGVTGAREAATVGGIEVRQKERRARDSVLAGTRVGPPRQFYSSAFVYTDQLDSAQIRALVDSVKAAGLPMIKTIGEDVTMFLYLATQARRAGLGVGGHLNDLMAPSALEASDSGVTVLDHALAGGGSAGLERLCVHSGVPWAFVKYTLGSLDKCQRAAARLRRNGTWLVLTFTEDNWEQPLNGRTRRIIRSYYTCSPVRTCLPAAARFTPGRAGVDTSNDTLPSPVGLPPAPDSSHFFDLAYRAGLPLLTGSHGTFTGIHTGLAMLVSEGFPPLAALQAATIDATRFLHVSDSLGTVEVGKLADLVLLDGDPLQDITNTTQIWGVVANGHYFDRATLDQLEPEDP